MLFCNFEKSYAIIKRKYMLLIFLKSYRKCDEISKELFEGAYFMTKILFVCHGRIYRA